MHEQRTAPYGAWRSALTAEMVASGGVGLGQIQVTGGGIYWVESRPLEGGRAVIVRRTPHGETRDVTPAGCNVRSAVHEYGGGAYWVHGDTLFFSNFADGRLYRQGDDGQPRPVTPRAPVPGALRYADGTVTPDGRLIVCVRERHQEGAQAVNELIMMPADGSAAPHVLVSGNDFYAFPRISPDGRQLAWTAWDHPWMPWDGTELRVAGLGTDGTLGAARHVAGGPDESIFQPRWSPQGVLHFVSDRTGWWNLYRESVGNIEALAPMEAEFGEPQWAFGQSTYAFLSGGRIGCAFHRDGLTQLGVLDPGEAAPRRISGAYTSFAYVQSDGQRLYCVAASPTEPAMIVALDPTSGAPVVLRQSRDSAMDPLSLSLPQPIEFPTAGGLTAHAFFYPPANQAYVAPFDDKPPLLVMSHGGPTSAAWSALDLRIQYWTSRGFAVVDVNYGGSTGYGRSYRQRLDGQWGIVDTTDCINAARYLVANGMVNGRRLAIRGSSAGGYTTLCALTFHQDFAAGASYYGIADAEALAADTHKFESRYGDRLIGPYPEARQIYRDRSPIHFTDRLSCPMILFQGVDDRVVPPAQAEQMVAALRAKGLPFAYMAFEGESHGFRKAETIRRTLEAELYFYSRVFGFTPADSLEPVLIENLSL